MLLDPINITYVCRLWIVCAGDLHFYMRHSYQPAPAKAAEETPSPTAAANASASSTPASANPGQEGGPRVNARSRAAVAGKRRSLADLVRGRSPPPGRASPGAHSSSPGVAARTQTSSKPVLGGQRRRRDPGTVMDPATVLDMYSDLLPTQSPLHSARSAGANPTAASRYVVFVLAVLSETDLFRMPFQRLHLGSGLYARRQPCV